MKSFIRLSSGLSVAVALSILSAPAHGDQPEDALITTKVKMTLLTDDIVDGLDINVDTFEGKVTLHGQVDSANEKGEAEALARKVGGVREVRNLLSIVPPKARKSVEVSDGAIEANVKTVLERDQALQGSNINVKSVNNGTVVLAGQAKTLSAHRRALEDARAVEGVRRLASEIRSPNELADAEIWEDASKTGAVQKLENAASDSWITTKVKVRLMAEPGLSPLAINVDTRNGIVSLFGAVGTEDLKIRAGAETREVSGVTGVENDLQVVPDVAAKKVEASDDRVKIEVRKSLEAQDALEDSDIDVAVKNGVVRLTGTVATQGDRFMALTVARSAAGVGSVIDGLEVKPQG